MRLDIIHDVETPTHTNQEIWVIDMYATHDERTRCSNTERIRGGKSTYDMGTIVSLARTRTKWNQHTRNDNREQLGEGRLKLDPVRYTFGLRRKSKGAYLPDGQPPPPLRPDDTCSRHARRNATPTSFDQEGRKDSRSCPLPQPSLPLFLFFLQCL